MGAEIPLRNFGQVERGSAMPLVWAHAEHMELRRFVRVGRVFDMPPQPIERHQIYKTESLLRSWRFNEKTRSIPAGKKLRIELLAAARVRWTANEWATSHDDDTREIGFGIHLVDLPTQNAARGSHIRFTFYWRDTERWEGMDFAVKIGGTEDIDAAVALEPPN